MPLNIEWAIDELETFVAAGAQHRALWTQYENAARRPALVAEAHDDVMARMPVVEEILDRAWPAWKDHLPRRSPYGFEYDPLVQVAKQGLVQLRRLDELQLNLGETGPTLSASIMDPDVWDSAKSLWRNGHFGEAVQAAAKAVNAKLQHKVNRRDLSEWKLVNECFRLDVPKPGSPRLRLMIDDGSDAYKSLHEGVMAFGQGCFKAIRNVMAHESGPHAEPAEDLALHYLAAFSTLAHWIDQATVTT